MQRRTRTGRQTPIAVSTCCGLLGMRRGLQDLRQRQHHSKLRKQDAQGRRPPTRAPPGSRRRGARPPRHRRSAAPEARRLSCRASCHRRARCGTTMSSSLEDPQSEKRLERCLCPQPVRRSRRRQGTASPRKPVYGAAVPEQQKLGYSNQSAVCSGSLNTRAQAKAKPGARALG